MKPEPLLLLLMRHGDLGLDNARRYVGQRDLPLSESGRGQAAAWGPVLAGIALAGAWCSDLSRGRESAALALADCPVSARALPGLREVNMGAWQGLTPDEIGARFPGALERRAAHPETFAPEGGESLGAAQRRFCSTLEAELPASGVVFVAAHATVNRACLCRALGLPLRDLFLLGQDYGCLNVLEIRPDAPARLLALNLQPGSALPSRLALARRRGGAS